MSDRFGGRLNYYEHHLGDYVRDTTHLSMQEEGAYLRLLHQYYIRERALPGDVEVCCRLARATTKPEREAVLMVLSDLFRLEADGYHQKRADMEIERFARKSGKAKVSANLRWEQERALRAQSEGTANAHANALPSHMRTHAKGISDRNALQSPVSNPQSPNKIHTHSGTAVSSARGSAATQRTRNGSVCVDEKNSDWEEREDAARG